MRSTCRICVLLVLAAQGGCASMAPFGPGGDARFREEQQGLGAEAGELPPEPQTDGAQAAADARRIIYTGRFAIVVSDVNVAMKATRDLAGREGGHLQRMTNSAIVIRVPAEKFDRVVSELAALGTVTQREITAQDVTEMYIDLQVRLRNAKATLEKLRALMNEARNVKEALAVQKELARVREEVERLEGRMNSLADRVAYATISVNFVETRGAPSELKARLPFPWLGELGLKSLLSFQTRTW